MKALFWISLFWVVYAYAGYLTLLMVFTLFRRERADKEDIYPDVTMIIAAFNEEKTIEKKIENCLELDYREENLEIIIVSDASTDRTEEIISRCDSERVKLLRMEERRGKTAAQNYAVSFAKGEILVFSDATTIYRKDALRKLVRNFRDQKVGIVAGEEKFRSNEDSRICKEVSLSWRYERVLRRMESKFNSLIGVSGCIFAIRADLYQKLKENLIEDFALPLNVLEKGYRVYLETEAVGYEEAVLEAKDEFRRKARIVSGGLNVLFNMRRLLNPFKHFKLSFQLVSHKIFRWFTPVFLVGLFISNTLLLNGSILFKLFFLIQLTGYGLAVIGFLLRKNALSIKLFKIPFYFCLVNLAAVIGIFRFLFKENKVIWEPVR